MVGFLCSRRQGRPIWANFPTLARPKCQAHFWRMCGVARVDRPAGIIRAFSEVDAGTQYTMHPQLLSTLLTR